MKSYTHIAGAIVLFLSFAYLTDLNQILIGVFCAGWISVFPDVFDKIVSKHKSYGHSIFWIVPTIIVGYFNFTVGAALTIGIISHSALDVITTNGTPILTPFWKTNFTVLNRKRRVKTGTNQDKAIFLAMIFLLLPMLFYSVIQVQNTIQNTILPVNTIYQDNINTNGANMEKNNININIQSNQATNKTIILDKVNQSETTIKIHTETPT
jgi:inner membrane protein